MNSKCPGQDARNIKAETMQCPQCGYTLELFSDEVKVGCPKCKSLVCCERLPSCIDWCRYARDCVGFQNYEKYLEDKSLVLKEKLIKALQEYFGEDKKRIEHARHVLEYAQVLLAKEGADAHIVIAASILHDVGIKAAESKYGSSAGHLQEKEGPEIARKILQRISQLKEKDINEICEIIAHHHSPGKINTQNFKVLYDADWLVNLKDEFDIKDKIKLRGIINKAFLTQTGRELALQIYLSDKA